MPCDPRELEKIKLFEPFEDELQELAAVIDEKYVVTIDKIFSAGDAGESLFVIRSGKAGIFLKDNTGQRTR